jgi:RNA polymerase sigma factor (TIGR02999 family)
MVSSQEDITRLLIAWSNGDREALSKLTPLVYDQLRLMASRFMQRERPDHTLQPTALVNEAFLRLVKQKGIKWQNRAHFFGISAKLMRQILVEHARSYQTAKRDSGGPKLSLDEAMFVPEEKGVDILALDDALTRLADFDPEKSRIVELRFFGGLNIEETAEVIGVSPATIKREWSVAKAWLHSEISREKGL